MGKLRCINSHARLSFRFAKHVFILYLRQSLDADHIMLLALTSTRFRLFANNFMEEGFHAFFEDLVFDAGVEFCYEVAPGF